MFCASLEPKVISLNVLLVFWAQEFSHYMFCACFEPKNYLTNCSAAVMNPRVNLTNCSEPKSITGYSVKTVVVKVLIGVNATMWSNKTVENKLCFLFFLYGPLIKGVIPTQSILLLLSEELKLEMYLVSSLNILNAFMLSWMQSWSSWGQQLLLQAKRVEYNADVIEIHWI